MLHGQRLPPPRRGSHLAVRAVAIAAILIAIGAIGAIGSIGALGCAHAATGPSAATRAAVERAEAAELRRDHAAARAAYQQAIAGAADRDSQVFARREYASSLEAWGEVDAAIAQLDAVVALDPRHAPSWHDLGILRHARGDDRGALAALATAESIVPDDPRPHLARAALLWQTGETRGATAEYEVLLTLELPQRVREKVEWALGQLRSHREQPDAPPAPSPAP